MTKLIVGFRNFANTPKGIRAWILGINRDTVNFIHEDAYTVTAVLQGGSNMTGTNCNLFTHNQSQSYFNHLVKGWRLKKNSLRKRPWRTREEVEICLCSFFNLGARWVWVINVTLQQLYPGKETRYSFYRRLVGHQDLAGRVQKTSSPLEFDPRTVEPVASRYATLTQPH